jgi:WD40 repeat protein
LDFGFAVSAAYVAPRQDAALVTAADGTVHLFQIRSGSAVELVLNGFSRAPERVVFSPSGTAAALYHSGSIEILNGLRVSPIVTTSFELTTAGVPKSMALSDDGALLLLAWGRSVELFASGAKLGVLTDTAGPAAVTFAPGTHDAAVADPLGAGIVWFRNLTGASESQVVAAPDDTIQSATAVAFSSDGRSLLVASPAGQTVTAFDLTDGTRTAIPCACAPTDLAAVKNLFRLNEFGGDPLWLLDTQQHPARIVFVPAAPDPGAAPR